MGKRKIPESAPVEQTPVAEEAAPSKKPHLSPCGAWKCLDLVLSLQRKDLTLSRKVEVAFSFSTSEAGREDPSADVLSVPHVASFIGGWVQPLLISSGSGKESSDLSDHCLDVRCWGILKFCLERSSFNVSASILRPIEHALRRGWESRDNGSSLRGSFKIVMECVSLLFASYSRTINKAGVELWVLCALAAVDIINGILSSKGIASVDSEALLATSNLVLEQFSGFLRFHSSPRNVFNRFVDKLVVPLLESVVLLRKRGLDNGCEFQTIFLKTIDDVLSNGLFHPNPTHMSWFLNVKRSDMRGEGNGIKGSYHLNLFKKVKVIVKNKKSLAISGLGELFHLLIGRVKRKREDYKSSKISCDVEKVSGSLEEVQVTNRPLMEVFIILMESLLAESEKRLSGIDSHEVGNSLEPISIEVLCVLKSVNDILVNFMHEKVYTRGDDSAEGANYDSLKHFYLQILSISGKVFQLWLLNRNVVESQIQNQINFIVKELVVSLSYFLEIEYKVIGEDLMLVWLMILSSLSVSASSDNVDGLVMVNSNILHLGCQLINLYTELRQVNSSIFALFQAVRFFSCDHGKEGYPFLLSSICLPSQICSKAVSTLLLSQDFRDATSSAMKTLPEGQASTCIEQLKSDIAESLKWIKGSEWTAGGYNLCDGNVSNGKNVNFCLQAELLGLLSEPYTILLDHLNITASNSNFVGSSVDNLISMLGPSFAFLVGNSSKNIHEFICFITERNLTNHEVTVKESCFTTAEKSAVYWIMLFYYRIYISCRSLYRQAISLMPRNAKQASATMGSLSTVYQGDEWAGKTDWASESYYSWITEYSTSTPSVMQNVARVIFPIKTIDHPPLVYVSQLVALQRLMELNRQIKSFDFLQGKEKKWRKLVKLSKSEASEITTFMTECLDSMVPDYTSKSECVETLADHDSWDLVVCSLDRNSLPTAVWWLLCRNVDIWCCHASSDFLKKFVYIVICQAGAHMLRVRKDSNNKAKGVDNSKSNISIHQISFELLVDMVLYEQPTLFRHFASRFLQILKPLVPLSCHASKTNVNLRILPDWSDIKSIIQKDESDASKDRNSSLPSLFFMGEGAVDKPFVSKLETCQNLINLLSQVIKVHVNAKSVSLFATCIINLERFVVLTLSKHNEETLTSCRYRMLSLFTSCRRALRFLAVASSDDVSEDKCLSFIHVFCADSFSFTWLLKSVHEIVALPYAFFHGEHSHHINEMFCVLMDHTSYVFFMLSKGLSAIAVHSVINNQLSPSDPSVDISGKGKRAGNSVDSKSLKHVNGWKQLQLVSEILKEQAENILGFYKLHSPGTEMKCGVRAENLNVLSNVTSCIQGFLYGLQSLGSKSKFSSFFSINMQSFIHTFEQCIDLCLKILHTELGHDCYPSTEEMPTNSTSRCHNEEIKIFHENHHVREQHTQPTDPMFHSNVCCEIFSPRYTGECISSNKGTTQLSGVNSAAILFSALDSLDLCGLHDTDKILLQRLLKGEIPEAAFLLKQLFTSSAVIYKLSDKFGSKRKKQKYLLPSRDLKLELGLARTLIQTSYLLLSEMAETSGVFESGSYMWLDGALKFLETIGGYISMATQVLPGDICDKLIDAHIRAIGKCIATQGKSATLALDGNMSNIDILSHEAESSVNDVIFYRPEACNLNEFKARLRMSFRNFIKGPLELRFLRALQRSLVGMHLHCTAMYDISTGDPDGGRISLTVAGGIECFFWYLNAFSGSKHLGAANKEEQKKHLGFTGRETLGLMGALFNIILHILNPVIFYQVKLPDSINKVHPDPGSVILMCILVLTKVAGKHASFEMDPQLVGQSLHLPMALFHDFHQLKDSRNVMIINKLFPAFVDRQFSTDLYAACCILLCTTLRHRKSEAERHIFLLQDSINVLLTCLETVDTDFACQKGIFAWETEEAIKCASYLRRVYEEIRQQKDLLARFSSHFLSSYVTVYSGLGPLKSGIKREIDEALKPGIYALFDICLPTDLQQLHTVLGDGPCRRTLANLQDDYKLNFQYEGKV